MFGHPGGKGGPAENSAPANRNRVRGKGLIPGWYSLILLEPDAPVEGFGHGRGWRLNRTSGESPSPGA